MRVEKVFAGIVLVFMGISLLMISAAMHSANVQYGGVVIIGPFPIAFGSTPSMAAFAIIFGAVMLLILLTLLRW